MSGIAVGWLDLRWAMEAILQALLKVFDTPEILVVLGE
jgi:hypothetical protein